MVVEPHGPHRAIVDERWLELAVVGRVAEDVDLGDLDLLAVFRAVEGNENVMLRKTRGDETPSSRRP